MMCIVQHMRSAVVDRQAVVRIAMVVNAVVVVAIAMIVIVVVVVAIAMIVIAVVVVAIAMIVIVVVVVGIAMVVIVVVTVVIKIALLTFCYRYYLGNQPSNWYVKLPDWMCVWYMVMLDGRWQTYKWDVR